MKNKIILSNIALALFALVAIFIWKQRVPSEISPVGDGGSRPETQPERGTVPSPLPAAESASLAIEQPQTVETLPSNEFNDPRGYITFSYPNTWKAYATKPMDVSFARAVLIPERSQSLITLQDGYPSSYINLDEYVTVTGAYTYYHSEVTPADVYAEAIESYERLADKGTLRVKDEKYRDGPALSVEFEWQGKKYYSFSALTVQRLDSQKTIPINFGFDYVATPELYDQRVANTIRQSFSDNFQQVVNAGLQK